jgi:hypothetical protein
MPHEPGIAPSSRSEDEELQYYQELERRLVAEARSLLQGTVMRAKPESLFDNDAIPEIVVAWKIADLVEKICELRKEKLRPYLHTWAERFGIPTDKGGQELLCGENRLKREHRTHHQLLPRDIEALLAEKGISLSEATRSDPVVDDAKLKALVDSGRLTAAEIEACKPTHYALQFEASKSLENQLGAIEGELGREIRANMAAGRPYRRRNKAQGDSR